jgi:hypothetical protein
MDLAASLHSVISNPGAAFLDPNDYKFDQEPLSGDTADICPLAPHEDQHSGNSKSNWRLDGCGSGGTQLYIVPLFLPTSTPLRIDTFIPDQSIHSSSLRKSLDSSALCHQGDGALEELRIVRHILQGLEHWKVDQVGLDERWASLPFGSQIIIDKLTPNPRDMHILLIPGYDVERKMLSVDSLRSMWSSSLFTAEWPRAVDIHTLQLQRQLNDSVSVVRFADQVLVFKSSNQGFHYLYHELKVLLTMPPHPNIIQAPEYLVTKRCRFGGKIGICGFLLPFYPLGSLKDYIPSQAAQGMLTLAIKIKWARQVTSALCHITYRAGSYFSDLRPDNVVLASGSEDAVLIDFEQRGNWFTWSPPEIYYREYLQHLAEAREIPEAYRDRCLAMLRSFRCGLSVSKDSAYQDSKLGSNEAWNSLTPSEQESASVFLLGKFLWCLFEEVVSVSSSDTIWRAALGHLEIEFPTFQKTPMDLRALIRACTEGAPEWEGRLFGLVRRGSMVFPRGREGRRGEGGATAEETLLASKRWWEEEVARMEAYFLDAERSRLGLQGLPGNDRFHGRPSLKDVLDVLDKVKRTIEETRSEESQ